MTETINDRLDLALSWDRSDDPSAMLSWITTDILNKQWSAINFTEASARKLRLWCAAIAKDTRFSKSYEDWRVGLIDDESLDKKDSVVGLANVWANEIGSGECSKHVRADLLRDVFGNPFRENDFFLRSEWIAPEATEIAIEIYNTSDFTLSPLLADCIEDRGCTNENLLAHLRYAEGETVGFSNGMHAIRAKHTRGCWAVDLILGLK